MENKKRQAIITISVAVLIAFSGFLGWYLKPTELFITDDRVKEIYQTATTQDNLPDDMKVDLERFHKTKVSDLLGLVHQNNSCQAQLKQVTTESLNQE